eukprot:UN16777
MFFMFGRLWRFQFFYFFFINQITTLLISSLALFLSVKRTARPVFLSSLFQSYSMYSLN